MTSISSSLDRPLSAEEIEARKMAEKIQNCVKSPSCRIAKVGIVAAINFGFGALASKLTGAGAPLKYGMFFGVSALASAGLTEATSYFAEKNGVRQSRISAINACITAVVSVATIVAGVALSIFAPVTAGILGGATALLLGFGLVNAYLQHKAEEQAELEALVAEGKIE